jgi:outer membrane protein TolC
MKPFALRALLVGVLLTGCTAYSSRRPPGPQPIVETPKPSAIVRERSPTSGQRTVVLNDRDGLSPDEAAVFAVDQNARLRAARAERGIARAELIEAGILPNPRVEGSVDFPVAGKDAQVLGYGAGISWNVTPLLSRGARVSAAEENLSSTDLEIAWQEWQVAQAARLHAVRGIYLKRRLRLAQELEQQAERRLEALREARRTNAVTELEVTNAERALAEARVTSLEVERSLAAERIDLNTTLGIGPTREVLLDDSFKPRGTFPSANRLLEDVSRRRLDLVGLQHAYRSHDEALRAATLAQFPPLEVGIRGGRDVDRVVSAGVTVSFDIPFFDRNQAAVARERALRTQVESEYAVRLLEARADVLRAINEITVVRKQLIAARAASDASANLAEQARVASLNGGLSPLVAADLLEQSYAGRLRLLEIEQTLAELEIALSIAAGTIAP